MEKTIIDLKKRKKTLESDIRELIKEFEDDYNVSVIDIYLEGVEEMSEKTFFNYVRIGVKV